jgi:hypothetical protein
VTPHSEDAAHKEKIEAKNGLENSGVPYVTDAFFFREGSLVSGKNIVLTL